MTAEKKLCFYWMLMSDQVANVEHFKWQQRWDFWVFGPTCLYTLIEGNTQRLPFTTGWVKAERRSKDFLFHLGRGAEPFLAGKMNPWLPATRRCSEYSVALTARYWLSIALRGAIYTRRLHGPTGRWGARDHLVTCKWGPLHCHTERRCQMSLMIFHHHPSLFWSATDIDLQPLFFPSNHRTTLKHDFPNCQMAPPPKANSSPFTSFTMPHSVHILIILHWKQMQRLWLSFIFQRKMHDTWSAFKQAVRKSSAVKNLHNDNFLVLRRLAMAPVNQNPERR